MFLLLICHLLWPISVHADDMPWIVVSKDKKGFVLEPSGKKFTPWGFNYDHDTQGRLLEEYWDREWDMVEAHFGQMKKLGANVVRIHLQVGKWALKAGHLAEAAEVVRRGTFKLQLDQLVPAKLLGDADQR